MILYIYDDFIKIKVIKVKKEEEIYSINKYLNTLATNNLMGIKSYKESVKKVLNIKSNIPIYFNDINLIFKIKSKDKGVYYINYLSLINITYNDNNEVMFIFNNANYLIIKTSIKSLKNQLNKCKSILSYLKKICSDI